MRIGLLGCGSVAYWIHRRALAGIRGVTLTAAADPDPDARARFTRASGVPVYERPEDLLGRGDIDAVLICVPTHLHAALALAAAGAGKPFYLEKPIATTLNDARCVVEATRTGLTAATGFNRRHHPLFDSSSPARRRRDRSSPRDPNQFLRAQLSGPDARLEAPPRDGRGRPPRPRLPPHRPGPLDAGDGGPCGLRVDRIACHRARRGATRDGNRHRRLSAEFLLLPRGPRGTAGLHRRAGHPAARPAHGALDAMPAARPRLRRQGGCRSFRRPRCSSGGSSAPGVRQRTPRTDGPCWPSSRRSGAAPRALRP